MGNDAKEKAAREYAAQFGLNSITTMNIVKTFGDGWEAAKAEPVAMPEFDEEAAIIAARPYEVGRFAEGARYQHSRDSAALAAEIENSHRKNEVIGELKDENKRLRFKLKELCDEK